MIPAFRSLDRASEAGEPLPSVWTTLTNADITPRRGELTMFAGPPGGGKSTLALNFATLAKVPLLYVSCDMGPHMSSVKIASILTGKPNAFFTRERKEEVRGLLATGASHLWLAHEQGPTLADLDELIQASIEVRGTPPHALVLDNLKDLGGGASGDARHTKDQGAADILKQMAGRYELAAIALAHTLVPRRPGYAQGMAEVKGQVSEDAALIVTVAGDPETGVMRLAGVKNRHGEPSPDASKYFELDWDGPSGVLTDPKPRQFIPPVPGWAPNFYEQDNE